MSRLRLKRVLFAAVVVASLVLAKAPSALAQTGYISGTVTDVTTGKPIGIEVDVYSSRAGFLVTSTCTAADGSYLLGLAPGTYYVGFVTSFCGAPGEYIPQYYHNKSSLQSADAVSVTDGVTTSGIDAAMRPGNTILGQVTDASTHAAIGGVEVDIFNSKDKFVATTCTASNGSYHVWVGFGIYEVGFGARTTGQCASPPNYLPQFYNHKSSLATADPVSVTNGVPMVTNAALHPAGAPTVTSVSPNSGPTAGGNTVTITGRNFVAGATVKFGATIAAAVTLVSATKLTVKAPAHAATIVNVRATTPKGTSPASSADHYTYVRRK